MAPKHDNCCSRCIGFLIAIGLTALFLWLSLRVDEPKCYLDYIYVPALNKTLNSSSNSTHNKNATIVFALKLANENKDKGIQYDDVLLSFRVFESVNTTRPLGNATVERFYQGHKKKATKRGNFTVGGGGGNLTAALDGKVWYRVDYATAVKYKIIFWYTKRHRLWGGANVEIGELGTKVNRKAVRLGGKNPVVIESSASKLSGRYRAPLLLPFAYLLACGLS